MTAVPATLTTYDPMLKEYYTDDKVQDLLYSGNAFFAALKKKTDCGGRKLPIPVIYAGGSTASNDFSGSQTYAYPSTQEAFEITWKEGYVTRYLSRMAVMGTKGNKSAFLDLSTLEIDAAMKSASNAISRQLFGTGVDYIGRLSASQDLTSGTITLATPTDAVNFEVGMTVQMAVSATSPTALSGVGLVSGVDRDNGTVTLSTHLDDTFSGIAVSAYIYPYGNASSTAVFTGLQGWLPYTAPTAGDSFKGVDRSADVTRLSGLRLSGTTGKLSDRLVELAYNIAEGGGRPSHCFMNNKNLFRLVSELGSSVVYGPSDTREFKFGGQSVLLIGPNGPIRVFGDRNCPNEYAYILQLDTWKLYSIGVAPHFYEDKMLTVYNADQYETRVIYYAALGCNAPGYNGVLKVA